MIPGNIGCSTVEPPPFFGRDEAELRACVTENMDRLRTSRPDQRSDVANLEDYRTDTPLFTVVLPEDNIFGVEPGVAQMMAGPTASSSPRRRQASTEIKASATYAGDPYPGTYTIIVEAPQVIEPPPTT